MDGSEDEEGQELGGLFRVSRPQNSRKANGLDCSRFNPDSSLSQDLEEVQPSFTHFSGASRNVNMEYIHTDVTDGLQRLSSDAELHQGLLRHREVGRRPGRSHAAEGGR